jgi:hypothetical protein
VAAGHRENGGNRRSRDTAGYPESQVAADPASCAKVETCTGVELPQLDHRSTEQYTAQATLLRTRTDSVRIPPWRLPVQLGLAAPSRTLCGWRGRRPRPTECHAIQSLRRRTRLGEYGDLDNEKATYPAPEYAP